MWVSTYLFDGYNAFLNPRLILNTRWLFNNSWLIPIVLHQGWDSVEGVLSRDVYKVVKNTCLFLLLFLECHLWTWRCSYVLIKIWRISGYSFFSSSHWLLTLKIGFLFLISYWIKNTFFLFHHVHFCNIMLLIKLVCVHRSIGKIHHALFQLDISIKHLIFTHPKFLWNLLQPRNKSDMFTILIWWWSCLSFDKILYFYSHSYLANILCMELLSRWNGLHFVFEREWVMIFLLTTSKQKLVCSWLSLYLWDLWDTIFHITFEASCVTFVLFLVLKQLWIEIGVSKQKCLGLEIWYLTWY